jgi:hypothetical protein
MARMVEGKVVYRVLAWRPEGKGPLGRHRRMWDDNINLDLREVEIYVTNWTQLARDSFQWRTSLNTVMKIRLP